MKKKSVFLILSLLFVITGCAGQQNNINDSKNRKDIFVLISDHYYSDKDNWYLYNVAKEEYENIKINEEVENVIDKKGYWFWDVFSGSSYIWTPGGSISALYKLYYDNGLKVQYSMNAEDYKSNLLGYPEIKTDTGFIKISPLWPVGTDNVPLKFNYFKVEVTLNSGQKKIIPNYYSNIIEAVYCGRNTLFAEITKSSELPVQTDKLLWDFVNDESYYFEPTEILIGFGEGAAVVTSKDYVGLSIIDVKGKVLYEDKEIDILIPDKNIRISRTAARIRSAYYIHPYILLNVQEIGAFPIVFQIINIETKEYTVLRDGDIFYEAYGMFVK